MTNIISNAISTVKNWWLLLILGILLLIGGIWVGVTPATSFLALTFVFIALLLVNGVFQIIFSLSNTNQLSGWGWYLTGGILEFLLGIYLWSYPTLTMLILPMIVGFWLLFRGITVIAHSTDIKEAGVKGWGWVMTFGILLTIFSFFVLMDPVFGALSVVYFISFAMIFMGIAYTILSFKLKELKSKAKDFLADSKHDINDLKNAVMEHLNNVDPEVKNKVNQMFDDYK